MQDKEQQEIQEEIIENLVKKSTELEKQVFKLNKLASQDYTEVLENIVRDLEEVRKSNANSNDLLNTINLKLDCESKPISKQIRILLFPETNQGLYYKIVFERLIPWAMVFMVTTYIFISGYRAMELYSYRDTELRSYRDRYKDTIFELTYYKKAWFYLRQHQKKKVREEMDEAFKKTTN